MLKKYVDVRWDDESKEAFYVINRALKESLVLISLSYKRDFVIFPFSLEHTIATVLLQKNDDGFEQPISFCNKSLRDCELKYNIMEKKAYALLNPLNILGNIFYKHVLLLSFQREQ